MLFSKETSYEKLELTSEFWVFSNFLQGAVPSWQQVGCQFLCQPQLTKLYNGLIDMDRGSKVLLGFLEEQLKTSMYTHFGFAANFRMRFKIVPLDKEKK